MNVLRNLAVGFLKMLLTAATAPVRDALRDGLKVLEQKAKQTPSPIDDAIVEFFIDVLE